MSLSNACKIKFYVISQLFAFPFVVCYENIRNGRVFFRAKVLWENILSREE